MQPQQPHKGLLLECVPAIFSVFSVHIWWRVTMTLSQWHCTDAIDGNANKTSGKNVVRTGIKVKKTTKKRPKKTGITELHYKISTGLRKPFYSPIQSNHFLPFQHFSKTPESEKPYVHIYKFKRQLSKGSI